MDADVLAVRLVLALPELGALISLEVDSGVVSVLMVILEMEPDKVSVQLMKYQNYKKYRVFFFLPLACRC